MRDASQPSIRAGGEGSREFRGLTRSSERPFLSERAGRGVRSASRADARLSTQQRGDPCAQQPPPILAGRTAALVRSRRAGLGKPRHSTFVAADQRQEPAGASHIQFRRLLEYRTSADALAGVADRATAGSLSRNRPLCRFVRPTTGRQDLCGATVVRGERRLRRARRATRARAARPSRSAKSFDATQRASDDRRDEHEREGLMGHAEVPVIYSP